MACCFAAPRDSFEGSPSQFSWKVDDPVVFNDAATTDDSSSLDSDKRMGPSGAAFPSWMKDEETDVCIGCDSRFTFRDRKHHCRRCRSIFCKNCTTHSSKILIFSIQEDVRVCDKCYLLLNNENNYFSQLRPMLHRGDTFKKSIRMGFSTKLVTLRMMSDDRTLVYDDETRAEPTVIPLSDIERINKSSLKAFEIFTDAKSYLFEADSSGTQKLWLEALKIAIKRAREPPLREQIECERRQRIETKKRAEYEQNRHETKNNERDSRKSERHSIKNKYGLV